MKLLTLKFKLMIGITLFIILVGACYSASIFNISNNYYESQDDSKIGKVIYKGQFLMPVENFTTVTSKYGERIHPITGQKSFHLGIDLVGNKESNILSVKDGEITWAGTNGSYGNCVEIKHKSEENTIFYTFYAHMKENSILVHEGQTVKEGQIIGTQGSTGNSTGDHLHFEIRLEDKTTIDPTPYLFNKE